jgi:hypothetical protein
VQAQHSVDTAFAAGSLKTLVTALSAAALVDTLKGKGPFTVFSPSDGALAKIPKADLDALLNDKAKLTAVLTYHLVRSAVIRLCIARRCPATLFVMAVLHPQRRCRHALPNVTAREI